LPRPNSLAARFRGFLPVVLDIETGGFDPRSDAILDVAGVLLQFEDGLLTPGAVHHFAVEPRHGTHVEPASLAFTGIDLKDPDRNALSELDAFRGLFKAVRHELKAQDCTRAIVVAHNAAFDHQFVMAAATRNGMKRNPFHPFSFIDTASLSAVAYGHTVLSRACAIAGIEFDSEQAHSARYDAERTALLFCDVVNRWHRLGGWPIASRLADVPRARDGEGD
jgi:ribonuclease T